MILRGILDFHRELLPELRAGADLFVCCHRQGDPSCTYLETLGCGVPIAGYENEALSGILSLADVGEKVGVDRPDELARTIARLDRDRDRLARLSRRAIAFARSHTFEETMARRVHHLARIATRRIEPRPALLRRAREGLVALESTLAAREVLSELLPLPR